MDGGRWEVVATGERKRGGGIGGGRGLASRWPSGKQEMGRAEGGGHGYEEEGEREVKMMMPQMYIFNSINAREGMTFKQTRFRPCGC